MSPSLGVARLAGAGAAARTGHATGRAVPAGKRHRRSADSTLAWRGRAALTTVAALCALAMLVLTLTEPLAEHSSVPTAWLATITVLLVYGVVTITGRIVTLRVPGNPVGWLIFTTGLLLLLAACCEWYVRRGRLTIGTSLPGGPTVAVLGSMSTGLAAVAFLLAVALFPTGRPVNQLWRVLLQVTVAAELLGGAVSLVRPGPIEGLLTGETAATNPLAVPNSVAAVPAIDDALNAITLPALALVALSGLFLRVRTTPPGPQRQQLKWALLGAAYTVIALPLDPLVGADGVLFATGLISLPIAMGMAMARYRLYAVDVVINRTLLYGSLTVLLIGVYVLVLSAIDAIGHDRGAPVVSAAATGVAALSLMPLYLWLRRIVNRITFGIRDDPRHVLRRMGGLLATAGAPDDVLPLAAADLARALRLPLVSIEIYGSTGYRTAALVGSSAMAPTTMALTYHGEQVGRLTWVGRLPHGALAPGDRRTIEDLTPQIAAAVASLRLTEELRQSRNRLITARDAERERIRRDLHDGLGPTLAAIGIQAELARELIGQNGDGSILVLTELKQQSAASVAEVRRIVDGLSPGALDQHGLADALAACAQLLSSTRTATAPGAPATARHGLSAAVDTDGDLTALAPAIQVAAYHIAVEAMTNAARHARATRVDTTLTLDHGALIIRTRDDGCGFPAALRPGTGLASMRQRARELGGDCIVAAAPGGGTLVQATIPAASM